MGVNLFGGKFFKCVDEHGVKYDAAVVPNKTACLQRGDRWIRSNVNFDNSFNGFLALLQVVCSYPQLSFQSVLPTLILGLCGVSVYLYRQCMSCFKM